MNLKSAVSYDSRGKMTNRPRHFGTRPYSQLEGNEMNTVLSVASHSNYNNLDSATETVNE